MTYEYSAPGQKTSVTNGDPEIGYQYYANGWLKAVTDGTNPYAEYTYDPAGNRTRVDLGNTTYTTYGYDADPRYRVSSVAHTPVGSSAVTISYPTRDSAGNPLSMTIGNTTTNYTYDANSRLVSAETSFAYDWVGNRNPSTHTYNAADQLTTSPGHVYEYWGTGSLQLQEDENTVTEKRYDYTPANLLESVTHADVSGQPVSSMTWDADSNRVSFTSSQGGTWSFVYDTTAGIPAVIEEVTPSGSVYYAREPNGALIARIDGETVNYYHFDALGSTRLLTDADGAVTDEYTYDAWGILTDHDRYGGSVNQPYQFVGQLGYYTHTQDTNLPLLQLGVRFYDPATGRFTQVDPIAGFRSAYPYAENEPLGFVDPRGEAKMERSECAKLRELIKGRTAAFRRHVDPKKGHFHSGKCNDLFMPIRDYYEGGCVGLNDYRKGSVFCAAVCLFKRYCTGIADCWPKDTNLGPNEQYMESTPLYDLCGCE